jgi:hypothetical protein
MFRLRATATIAISIFIAKAGVGIEAALVATAFVPVLTFGLDTGGGLRAAFEMRLVLQPFAITVRVVREQRYIELLQSPCACTTQPILYVVKISTFVSSHHFQAFLTLSLPPPFLPLPPPFLTVLCVRTILRI